MKNIFLVGCVMLTNILLFAQRSAPDEIQTDNGMLQVQPILHGTVVFTWNGKTIYSDPYGGAKALEGIAAPDLILITDIHGDHMSLETLQALDLSKAIIVAPQAVADKLPEAMKAKTVVIGNGQKTNQLSIDIEAVPMYNLPEDSESRHTKGRGNGYVLNLGGKRVYISGDTEDIPEMRNLKNIDVAFVCMNQPFTMDIQQAASAVLDFKPKIVYPFHYRGQNGLSDVEGFKELVHQGNSTIDVRLRNWYPN